MTAEKIDGRTMGEWLAQVDGIVNKRCGISVHDLADFPIWHCWDDGMTPENGADEALNNDDLPWLETFPE